MKILSCEVGVIGNLPGTTAKVVLSTQKTVSKGPIHWVINWDVSGSMSGVMNQVKRDINGFISALPNDHYVSIVIFSGHDESRVVAKSVQSSETGKKTLASKIDAVRILSTTVFSDGLENLLYPITDTMPMTDRHQVILFTDGCPVPTRWSVSQEIQKSRTLAAELKTPGAVISTIGYGNYYNDAFLAELVDANGGIGISRHINDITSFPSVIADIRNTGEMTTTLVADLKVTVGNGKIGRVLRGTPQIQKVGDNGNIRFQSVMDGEVTLYMSLPAGTKDLQIEGTVDGQRVKMSASGKSMSAESVVEATLAFASYHFQSGDLKLSADLLNQSGNNVLAMMVGSAYTDRERLTIADEMRRILLDNGIRQRYSTKKYIGAGKAPCVVNLLRTLLEEDCTVFIPKGTYQKTTVTVVESDMRHKPNAKMKMTEIQSNEERYNISMKTVVDVEEKDKTTGRWKDGVRFRNYVIIKDGNLHQDKLEAYLSKKAFELCQEWDVIPENTNYSDTKLFTLDLTSLPMIVASWANPKQLGLIDLMKEEMILAVKLKALNSRVKELRTGTSAFTDYPKKTKLDGVVDTYTAPAFEYELKGFTAPKFDFSGIVKFEEAEEEARKTRKRLLNVRCIKRLILFAMDKSGNKLFDGITPTPVKRSTTGKMEQTVNLSSLGEPSLLLRRIMWTEEIDITGGSTAEDDQMVA